MNTLTLSLPDNLQSFVDQQVAERGYGTRSEYVRELIRKDQDRQQLRALLLAGAQSGAGDALDADDFNRLRARLVQARYGQRGTHRSGQD